MAGLYIVRWYSIRYTVDEEGNEALKHVVGGEHYGGRTEGTLSWAGGLDIHLSAELAEQIANNALVHLFGASQPRLLL